MVGMYGQPLHAYVGNAILCFMTEWKCEQINPGKQAISVIYFCTKSTTKLNSLKQQCTLIISQLLRIMNLGTAYLGPRLQDHLQAAIKASMSSLIYRPDLRRTHFELMQLFTGLSSLLVVVWKPPSAPYHGDLSTMIVCFINAYKQRNQQSSLSRQKS